MASLLTDELVDRVVAAERETGLYPRRLLVSLGVGVRSAERWLEAGRLASGDGVVPVSEHQRLCVRLYEELELAEGEVEARWWGELNEALVRCRTSGKSAEWTALMTRLERRFPERYRASKNLPVEKARDPADVFARLQESEASSPTQRGSGD